MDCDVSKRVLVAILSAGLLSPTCNTTTQEPTRELTSEEQIVKNYLDRHDITATFDDSGLFYVNHGGGRGKKARSGRMITVHYTGMLLDGSVFDTSLSRAPLAFQLGLGRLIKGWEIGLTFFRKGDKGTLYIPSTLAYGSAGLPSGGIPPDAALIYEIEVVDVE